MQALQLKSECQEKWTLSEFCYIHSEAISDSTLSGVVCLCKTMILGDCESDEAAGALVGCLPLELKDAKVSNAIA